MRTFPSYPTRASWESRAEHLRKRILVSAGLWPMPEKRPLDLQVTGRIEHDEYAIENVYFQSLPGFLVTGNLYLPRGKPGPFPGVLSPHGHWEHGRLEHGELGSIPSRCITFARQGYVAFAYDMIGYNDSGLQIRDPEGGRDHIASFIDPQSFLWGISLMGLQLWNSIRAVDMLLSLPQVDPQRVACTGASGGGTQTFMLTAVDSRVKASAPVNMISAHMQGGCLCENIPNLRLDGYNVEFGAMMAPRPLLMVSATGDWTRNTPQVEFPDVQSIYQLYEAADKVATVQVDALHNYNQESREAVYAWLGKWMLGIDDAESLKEGPLQVDPPEEMRVFPDGKLPESALTGEEVTANLIQDAQAQIDSLKPVDAATLHAAREILGTAYRYALNAVQPQADDLRVEQVGSGAREGVRLERLIIGRKKVGEQMPALLFLPNPLPAHAAGVLAVHPEGKAGWVTAEGPGELIAGLLAQGSMVLAIDPFGTGELRPLQRGLGVSPTVGHFYTYNKTDTAERVQDILNGLAYLLTRTYTVHLVGAGQAGLWCLLARGLARDVAQTVVDAARFDVEDDAAWVDQLFVPQVRRAGDFRTAAALAAPGKLFIHNTAGSFPEGWFRQVYEVAGAPEALHVQAEPANVKAIMGQIEAFA